MEIPKNIAGVLIGLILGAGISLIVGIVIIVERRKMPYEVWIPLLALCCLILIGCSAIALCLAAAFTIAD